MLIDAGGSRFQSRFDPGEHVLAPLLRKLGATKIDYVVITHPDRDHIGGLEYLFERFSVGEVWLDQAFLGHPRLRKDLERVRTLGGEVRTFQDLPNTMFLGRTKIDMIYPRASHGLGEGLSTNQLQESSPSTVIWSKMAPVWSIAVMLPETPICLSRVFVVSHPS